MTENLKRRGPRFKSCRLYKTGYISNQEDGNGGYGAMRYSLQKKSRSVLCCEIHHLLTMISSTSMTSARTAGPQSKSYLYQQTKSEKRPRKPSIALHLAWTTTMKRPAGALHTTRVNVRLVKTMAYRVFRIACLKRL
jgi:hypothetical protein